MTEQNLPAAPEEMSDAELVEAGRCANCRKQSHVPPSVRKKGYGRYCSRSCYYAATRKHPFVEYRGKHYSFSPTHGYYIAHDSEKLHRRVWMDAYGAPPEGCVIHHKDGNKLNNELSNLQVMPWDEHTRHHKAIGRRMADYPCSYCKKVVRRVVSTMKRTGRPFCTRRCHMLHRNRVLGIRQITDVSDRIRSPFGTFLPRYDA